VVVDYQRAAELYGYHGDLNKCAEMFSKAAEKVSE
jgi:hypothetical protein